MRNAMPKTPPSPHRQPQVEPERLSVGKGHAA
jgi:hypothetical protein